MNRLFSLPENIISNIYDFDPTYHKYFKKYILHEIWKGSFVHFKHNLLSNPFFQSKPILRGKIYTLLKYLFEDETTTWFRYDWYDEHKSVEKPMTSDLIIMGSWMDKKFNYNIKTHFLWTDDCNDTDDDNNNYFNYFDYFDNVNHDTFFVEVYLKYPCLNTRVKTHYFNSIIYSNQQYQENLDSGYQYTRYLYKYNDTNNTIMQYLYPTI